MKKSGIIILLVLLTLLLTAVFLLVLPHTDNSEEKKAEKEEEQTEEAFYTISDPFITNIKDSRRFVKTSIALEMTSQEAADALVVQDCVIKDTILKILRSKTEAEYMAENIQDALSQEIYLALTEKLEVDTINRVYFMELVVQ